MKRIVITCLLTMLAVTGCGATEGSVESVVVTEEPVVEIVEEEQSSSVSITELYNKVFGTEESETATEVESPTEVVSETVSEISAETNVSVDPRWQELLDTESFTKLPDMPEYVREKATEFLSSDNYKMVFENAKDSPDILTLTPSSATFNNILQDAGTIKKLAETGHGTVTISWDDNYTVMTDDTGKYVSAGTNGVNNSTLRESIAEYVLRDADNLTYLWLNGEPEILQVTHGASSYKESFVFNSDGDLTSIKTCIPSILPPGGLQHITITKYDTAVDYLTDVDDSAGTQDESLSAIQPYADILSHYEKDLIWHLEDVDSY